MEIVTRPGQPRSTGLAGGVVRIRRVSIYTRAKTSCPTGAFLGNRLAKRTTEMQTTNLYEVSTDRRRLNVDLIHGFLSSSSWAQNIPRRVVEKLIQHSLCFGAFCGGQQVGFGRVITDCATFAYIADVFVVPEHRSHGVAKLVLRAMLQHPDLQGLRRILLATVDAHKLYEQFGFQLLTHPEHYMTIHRPDVYAQGRHK